METQQYFQESRQICVHLSPLSELYLNFLPDQRQHPVFARLLHRLNTEFVRSIHDVLYGVSDTNGDDLKKRILKFLKIVNPRNPLKIYILCPNSSTIVLGCRQNDTIRHW